jgi:hypothetical protein
MTYRRSAKGSTRKRIALAVAVLGIVCLAALTYLVLPNLRTALSEHGRVIERFTAYSAAVERGDVRAAYDICSEEFKKVTPWSAFVSEHAALATRRGALRGVQVEGTHVQGRGAPMEWTATVYAAFHYDRKTVRRVYDLREVRGTWLIDAYREEK